MNDVFTQRSTRIAKAQHAEWHRHSRENEDAAWATAHPSKVKTEAYANQADQKWYNQDRHDADTHHEWQHQAVDRISDITVPVKPPGDDRPEYRSQRKGPKDAEETQNERPDFVARSRESHNRYIGYDHPWKTGPR